MINSVVGRGKMAEAFEWVLTWGLKSLRILHRMSTSIVWYYIAVRLCIQSNAVSSVDSDCEVSQPRSYSYNFVIGPCSWHSHALFSISICWITTDLLVPSPLMADSRRLLKHPCQVFDPHLEVVSNISCSWAGLLASWERQLCQRCSTSHERELRSTFKACITILPETRYNIFSYIVFSNISDKHVRSEWSQHRFEKSCQCRLNATCYQKPISQSLDLLKYWLYPFL